VPVQAPKPTAVPNLTASLVAPPDGSGSGDKDTFVWQANFTPAAGQAFEVVFWKEGQDALRDGRGWGGTSTTTSVTINWQTSPAAPDTYLWGVLLVETNPYKRVRYLGGGDRRYSIKDSAGALDSGSGSNSEPEATLAG